MNFFLCKLLLSMFVYHVLQLSASKYWLYTLIVCLSIYWRCWFYYLCLYIMICIRFYVILCMVICKCLVYKFKKYNLLISFCFNNFSRRLGNSKGCFSFSFYFSDAIVVLFFLSCNVFHKRQLQQLSVWLWHLLIVLVPCPNAQHVKLCVFVLFV